MPEPLSDILVAYWKLDEVGAGTRYDSFGANDLTDAGKIESGSGICTGTAVFFHPGELDSSLLSNSTADLAFGDVTREMSGWAYVPVGTNSYGPILCKRETFPTAPDYEIYLNHNGDSSTFTWQVRDTGNTANGSVTSGTVTVGWHFIDVYHDAALDEIGIAIDGGAFTVAPWSGGIRSSSGQFALGRDPGVGSFHFNSGLMSNWALFTKLLTTRSRDFLAGGDTGGCPPDYEDVLDFEQTAPVDIIHETRIYTTSENGSDVRVYLPNDWITQISFEITERGGFGEGSLRIIAPWDALPGLIGSERIDVWLWNVLVYRGWLNLHERDIDNPEMFAPRMAGLIETLNRTVVNRRYAYSSPQDVARIWGDIVADYVTASVITDSQYTGATLQVFDARDETVPTAFNRLCDQSPLTAIWGHDTTSDYSDRLYLRQRATAITHRVSIGGEVQGYAHPLDTGAVRNVLHLRGGKVAQPNLAQNGSFEETQPPSETVGNLITDYSFEDDAAAWSGTSSGSRKQTGGGADAMGAPRSGSWWYEIDQDGEKAEQTVSGISSSFVYVASAWVRREDPDIARTFTFEVEGLDSGDNVQVTITIAAALDPGGGQWRRYSGECDFTGYALTEKARLRIRAHAGSASNDGILIDDVAFYERDSVANAEWEWSLAGNATRVTLDWHAKDVTPYHGGYCVRMLANDIAGAGDYLELRNTKTARVNVKPGQSYVVAAFVRGDGINSVSASIGVSQWKADDTSAGTDTESATLTGNLETWTLLSATFTAASAASTVDIWLRDRANTILYADAFALIETALPVDWYSGGYWPADTYERVWDTNIIPPSVPGRAPAGISAAASASIATYGRREEVVVNDQVVDEATGQAFAIGWFNAHAVPQVSAQLRMTATRSEDLVFPSGLIRLLNLPSAPDALFPSRIRYTIDGEGVEIEVDLGSQRPELIEMLRVIAGKRASGELPA